YDRSPVSRSTKNNAWNEVVAIILLGVGTLLFLALISYNPKDLPSWVPWSYLSPPNKPVQNFIGPFGVMFAGFCYLTIGAASYLVAVILLSGIYVASLILMTGLRPIHLVHQTVSGTRDMFSRLHEWRLHRQLRKADIKGQLEISQRELSKQRRSIEKQLKKKGAPVPEPSAAFISPEELADRPAPTVVDATALPDESIARKKPSLAELRGSSSRSTSSAPGLNGRASVPKTYALPGLDLLAEHDPEGRGGADPTELQRVQQTL